MKQNLSCVIHYDCNTIAVERALIGYGPTSSEDSGISTTLSFYTSVIHRAGAGVSKVLCNAGTRPVPPVDEVATDGARRRHQTCELLGLRSGPLTAPGSELDIHTALVGGALSWASLFALVSHVHRLLQNDDVLNVLGMSRQILNRHRENAKRPLSAALASKVWRLAEILVRATTVFGGCAEALQWMRRSAAGLDGHRPIELLQTIQGTALVDEFLTRLEYDVYT